jgi:hypothetical protein
VARLAEPGHGVLAHGAVHPYAPAEDAVKITFAIPGGCSFRERGYDA